MSNTKKALLVGINYTTIPSATLKGCINDVTNMSGVLTDSFDYDINNITVLRDDLKYAPIMPTRANILNSLTNLVNQSANLTEIWFHYSGHGSQIKDTNNDEIDGADEIIVPIDFQTKGVITDDEIFNIIKNSKCKTIILFDSCHSASMCDLQWNFDYTNNNFQKSIVVNKTISNPNIFCFSGCKDNQTSADAYSVEQQRGVGAFTDTFIRCLRINHMNVNILKLYSDICNVIKAQGFTQIPNFSSSSPTPEYSFTRVNATQIAVSKAPVQLVTSVKQIPVPTAGRELILAPLFSQTKDMFFINEKNDSFNENDIFSKNDFVLQSSIKRTQPIMGKMFDRL